LVKNKDMGLWHKRLGHPLDKVLNRIFNYSSNTCNTCGICKMAKQAKLPFSLSTSKTHSPFELVHSDVWGPATLLSYNGFKYFVLFIDDFFENYMVIFA
jgi:GAG-pre-integrase domain